MHLRELDLNLAVVLQALFDEGSVSGAARRLGLSQSATSHALARLRVVLQDPLFVRTAGGFVPTTRAEAMREPLRQGLASLERSFSEPRFDPATARHTFRIALGDYAEYLLMPPLLTRLAAIAPGIDVWTSPPPADAAETLAQGALDLVLTLPRMGDHVEGLHTCKLWDDHFVGVVRRGHPLTRGKLTVERFAGAQHAVISPRGQPVGIDDDALGRRGLTRRVAFATANFLVAPHVVADSDLVLTLSARLALTFARTMPLEIFEPPLPGPDFTIAMFWHERRHTDPAHQFLRAELQRAARALPVIARPVHRKRRAA
ncbi:MAG: LysR family transcriptional regulator [Myxococcales bacterium]|nr:MAG: LysR family transcriptional regulator [Myxococcales bacterium]